MKKDKFIIASKMTKGLTFITISRILIIYFSLCTFSTDDFIATQGFNMSSENQNVRIVSAPLLLTSLSFAYIVSETGQVHWQNSADPVGLMLAAHLFVPLSHAALP